MRGKIRNKQQARVLRDYSGLRYGAITPTDIDGFFEIKDKHYIFIEIKYNNSSMPRGQELALTRLIDALAKAGKLSLLIIATHHVQADEDIEIDVASCCVAQYRLGGDKKWRCDNDQTYSVRQCIDDFLVL